jgi:Na+-transporting methylmalonyl-CoA/oxaloacetate decarboxylase gamma subunit
MDTPLVISLIVSGIGMLLLFLALAFLCGLMYLMTAFIKDRPRSAPPSPPPTLRPCSGQASGGKEEATSRGAEERELRCPELVEGIQRRAAVIAVALARAEQTLSATAVPPVEEAATAWQTLHRQRQLTLRPPTRRAQ